MGTEDASRDSRDSHPSHAGCSPPIFCEQCPDLAMAVVEDSALCLRCMMEAIEGRSESWMAANARPLLVRPS